VSTAARVLAGTARWACERGHCAALLGALPAGCVHCCVTSPPYYRLRAYLDDGHPDKALELGTEETPEEYVERTVCAFRAVRRVLHPSGTLWLNLGDSYASHGAGADGKELAYQPAAVNRKARKPPAGLKAKDLVGVPWMVAFALRADGWYLRQWCPWVKRNQMPESVEDRPGTGCETVFLLSKRADYFFDMETVKRANSSLGTNQGADARNFRSSDLWFDSVGMLLAGESDAPELLGFDVTLGSYKGAHFAVMPRRLVEPCVLAGTSAKGVCPACGAPWVRVVERERKPTRPGKDTKVTPKMKPQLFSEE
jgi:hypothetical protein